MKYPIYKKTTGIEKLNSQWFKIIDAHTVFNIRADHNIQAGFGIAEDMPDWLLKDILDYDDSNETEFNQALETAIKKLHPHFIIDKTIYSEQNSNMP